MKILLINPRMSDFKKISQRCFPPLGILYIAAALLKDGFEVKIIDANAFSLTDSKIVQMAQEYSPDLVGISVCSEISHQVYNLVKELRNAKLNTRFILGGPDANAQPEKVLQEYEDADFVLKGECEKTMVELCQILRNKGSLDTIPGLYYRDNGIIIHNDSSPSINNLEDLSLPAKELLREAYSAKKYYSVLAKGRLMDAMITSRGCPFSCNFCFNRERTYRAISIQKVMEELHNIYSRGIKYIRFDDDNFTINRERAMKIFDLIEKEKLNINLEIKTRANLVDKELIEKAKRAGVYLICYGMESANQQILDRMQKGIKVEDIINACELTKRAGLKCHTCWIFGFPGETPVSIKNTIDFIIKLRPTTVTLSELIPYPETAVYREGKDTGTLIGDWSAKDDYVPWIKLPWMKSKADLLIHIYSAQAKFYSRPYYLKNYSLEILRNFNLRMFRYAWQEAVSCQRNLLRKAP